MTQLPVYVSDNKLVKSHELEVVHEVFTRKLDNIQIHKTVLTNIIVFGLDCRRPHDWLVKYLSINNGVRAYLNDITKRFVLMDIYDANDLRDQLDKFIIRYVVCPMCKSCETKLHTNRDKIFLDCESCHICSDFWAFTRFDSFITQIIRPVKQCIIITTHIIIQSDDDEIPDEDDDWCIDISDEAVAKRQDEMICCISTILL